MFILEVGSDTFGPCCGARVGSRVVGVALFSLLGLKSRGEPAMISPAMNHAVINL
jgi:hypothetical protein